MNLAHFHPMVAATAIVLSLTASALGQSTSCNPQYVFHSWKTWQVMPTGTDDTANLQCAFDQAVTLPGSTVLLIGGTYHTGQVAVSGFVGTFRGAGMDLTVIQTLDRPLRVTTLDFQNSPPTPESGSNPWPSVFAFVGGDLTISDLSLYATVNSGTTGWTFTGLGVIVYELAHGFVIVGSPVSGQNYRQANAELNRVHVEGLTRSASLYGYNLINAAYYEGFFGPDLLPLHGTFGVHDCEFRQVGGSTNVYNVSGAQLSIKDNRYADSFEGMDIGQVTNTSFKFTGNEALNVSTNGILLYGPWDSSLLSVDQNVFTGVNGPFLDDTLSFAGPITCHLVQNSVSQDTGVGIYLGQGTKDCLVVCRNRTDTVTNLGTGNKLVSCQQHPSH